MVVGYWSYDGHTDEDEDYKNVLVSIMTNFIFYSYIYNLTLNHTFIIVTFEFCTLVLDIVLEFPLPQNDKPVRLKNTLLPISKILRD